MTHLLTSQVFEGWAEAILTDRLMGSTPLDAAGCLDARKYLEAQIGRMPDPLSLGARLGLWGLDRVLGSSGLVPFHRLPLDRRLKRLQALRRSFLGPVRDVVFLLESLTLYAWTSSHADD